ncbi:hypothetical protein EDD86DRAFT_206237 [Gorgonomyces haynaldii]|nr:hypothetical protein EDD86DRAFT_206237 [Gorgonomyces haynaldii]
MLDPSELGLSETQIHYPSYQPLDYSQQLIQSEQLYHNLVDYATTVVQVQQLLRDLEQRMESHHQLHSVFVQYQSELVQSLGLKLRLMHQSVLELYDMPDVKMVLEKLQDASVKVNERHMQARKEAQLYQALGSSFLELSKEYQQVIQEIDQVQRTLDRLHHKSP